MFFRKKKKASPPVCAAVVAAAGSSSRMGEDKLLLPLDGEPVIVHTLRALSAAPSIGEIVLVTREDLMVPISQLCRDYGLTKVVKVIRGGEDRAHSVYLGTLEVDRHVQVIAVHDGARPFVTVPVIEEAVDRALKTGAAAPAVPVKDTIKEAVDGLVERTLDRDRLFAVQTPQVFEAGLLKAALQKALDDRAPITDDCAAVERLGMKVALTHGDERNIKLTTPNDLAVAESILAGSKV